MAFVVASRAGIVQAEPPPSASFGTEGPQQPAPQTPPYSPGAASWAPSSAPTYPAQPTYPPPGAPGWYRPAPVGLRPPAVPEEKPPEVPRDWSLGAGLGFGDSFGGLGSLSALSGEGSASTPSYRLSIERRLGGSTWLVLNGALSYSQFDTPLNATIGDPPERNEIQLESSREAILVGIRQVVATGLVELSLYLAAGAAHEALTGGALRTGEFASINPGTTADTFGVMGGFAVERELIPALAVRLGADLVGVGLSRTDSVSRGADGTNSTRERNSQSVGLALRPAIQLQFYF